MIADRIGQVTEDFEQVWREHGGGHDGQAHDGAKRSCLVPFIDQNERLSMLLDDPRIRGIAVSLLGEDFNYMAGDGNFYAGVSAWHIDGESPARRHFNFSFYLDPLDGDSGALRVIPGSHHLASPMRRMLVERSRAEGFFPEEAFAVAGDALPSVALATRPGDVIIMDHNIFHSSWHGGPRRRLFTMNLCQRYAESELEQLQGYLANHARFLIERNVGDAMLRVATPRMRRHLEQVLENDFLLTERTREGARQGGPSRPRLRLSPLPGCRHPHRARMAAMKEVPATALAHEVLLLTAAGMLGHVGGFGESPARLRAAWQGIEAAAAFGVRLRRVEALPAASADLERAHTARYIQGFADAVARGEGWFMHPDCPLSPQSEGAARLAAGAAAAAARGWTRRGRCGRSAPCVRPGIMPGPSARAGSASTTMR